MEHLLSALSGKIKENAIDAYMDSMKPAVRDPVFFSVGMPNCGMIPKKALQRIMNEIFDSDPAHLYEYCSAKGFGPFLSAISGNENIPEPYIMATNGNTQGFDLVCRMLLDEQDGFAMEAYTYSIALSAVHQYRLKVVGIPLEQDGLDIDFFEKALKTTRIKALYIIPNAQNPTGITTSLEKRKRLIELAYRHGFLIIEDDPYRDLLFHERFPSIFELDPLKEKVIYLYSFSKVIAPAMRTGFILAHPALLQKLEQFKQVMDACTSPINQMLAGKLVSSGSWPAMLEKQKRFYEKRKEWTKQFLQHMNETEQWEGIEPAGGLFYWMDVKKGDVLEWMGIAAEAGAVFVPGNAFTLENGPNTKIRLCFAHCSDEEMGKGFVRLEESFKKWKNMRGSR
ncbi:aminotransferase [Weizmannia acidilactici]|uniref:Aminotransferase n=1 Tax=Weizmannia acidilactici TaxID=2607726 RepID=A0A5J4JF72_9BACI|nr:PLP-dependent aminotransferase family protein [Weizmannia acidilactici]GER67090.1 aminotransferase [Weizmannia acidilactici]GER70331.1 aminotransferase [Weizmannia acidilactici]